MTEMQCGNTANSTPRLGPYNERQSTQFDNSAEYGAEYMRNNVQNTQGNSFSYSKFNTPQDSGSSFLSISGFKKESVNKPAMFKKGMDIRKWWERFSLFVEDVKVEEEDIFRVLKSFLDDECLDMVKWNFPSRVQSMKQIEKLLFKLFDVYKGEMCDLRSKFYTRVQQPNEDLRVFMTSLWKLADEAFFLEVNGRDNYDFMVMEKFIHGLRNQTIKENLRLYKPGSSQEALNKACDLWYSVQSALPDSLPNIARNELIHAETTPQPPQYQASITSLCNSSEHTVSHSQNSGTQQSRAEQNVPARNDDFHRKFSPPSQELQTPILRKCFNCGSFGHISRECRQGNHVNPREANRFSYDTQTPQPPRYPNQQTTPMYRTQPNNSSSYQQNQITTTPLMPQQSFHQASQLTPQTTTTPQPTQFSSSTIAQQNSPPVNSPISQINSPNTTPVLPTNKVSVGNFLSEEVVPRHAIERDKRAKEDVITGTCKLNNSIVQFLFDTGASRTLVAKEAWDRVRSFDSVLKQAGVEMFSCDGKRVRIDGLGTCRFESFGVNSEIDVIVVDGLTYDCLLGLDVARKLEIVNKNLNAISDFFKRAGQNPSEPEKELSSAEQFSVKCSIYQASICEEKTEIVQNAPIVEKEAEMISVEERERFVSEIANEFSDVIAEGLENLSQTDICEHEIKMSDETPIKQPMRRVPYAARPEYKAALEEMMQNGIISESESPWTSPTVLVRKKDGGLRICIDFRQVNDRTIKDCYPLPKIEDIIVQLGRARWFSTLDLASGYHQIRIKESDKMKAAFRTEFGLFQYNVMPFGLTNAPSTFQRMMEKVLRDLLGLCCYVYLDDVVIFSVTFEQHRIAVRMVLLRLRTDKLMLQWRKCHWVDTQIEYLGHVVQFGRVRPAFSKVEVLYRFKEPKTVKQVQSFLGLASYYRRFIKGFAEIASPLHRITEKESKFIWTGECQNSFDRLRKILSSEDGVLILPDLSQEFRLETDACNVGLGAVLSQSVDGFYRPCAYWSKHLSLRERKYSTSEKELLAVVLGMEHFRQFLLGRKFTIVTDHKPLIWLRRMKNPAPRLARWLLRVREFDFELVYRDGKQNGNADALSRWLLDENLPDNFITEANTEEPGIVINAIFFQQVDSNEMQKEDEDITRFKEYLISGKQTDTEQCSSELKIMLHTKRCFRVVNNTLFRVIDKDTREILQLVVPKTERPKILNLVHDATSGGHLGFEKTFAKIKRRYYWPDYYNQIKDYVRKCPTCAQVKTPPHYNRTALKPLKPSRPFQIVTSDIMGPLPVSYNGNKYVLAIIDHFTKWTELFAIPDQEAKTVVLSFLHVIADHGVPDAILTDQGRNFESQLIEELCDLLDIHKIRTSPYYPECDGQTERFNRTLESMLASFVEENQRNWDELLPVVNFAYRTAVHKTTNFSPFELLYGRLPKLPCDLFLPGSVDNTILTPDSYGKKLKAVFESIYKEVQSTRSIRIEKFKFFHDRNVRCKSYSVGDLVWLEDSAPKPGLSKKLRRKWKGPFKIIARLSDSNYKIKGCCARSKTKVVNIKHLKTCFSEPNRNFESVQNSPEQVRATQEQSTVDDQAMTEQSVKNDEVIIRPHDKEGDKMSEKIPDCPGDYNEMSITKKTDNDNQSWSLLSDEDLGLGNLQPHTSFYKLVEITTDAELSSNGDDTETYEPNAYFRKTTEKMPVSVSPRPKRNRRVPDRLNYC